MNGADLAGLGVLVTRPARQAESLCTLIEAQGGRPVRFPALDIQPPQDPSAARRLLAQSWDLLIFVSANAVSEALALAGGLPDGIRLAVGAGTAQALAAAGWPAVRVPERADSEGLLALPELAEVAGRRILILRGEGGRALLGDSLVQRGAEVVYAEVYRRLVPQADPAPLLRDWRRDIQAIIATSGELLTGLDQLLGAEGRALARSTPLVVAAPRIQDIAQRLGYARVRCAAGAGDAALVAALAALVWEATP